MTLASFLKFLGACVGAVVASLLPAPVLITMFWCVTVAACIDAITGIQAAIECKIPVTVHDFIGKSGRKMTRATAYMGLAWIAAQLLADVIGSGHKFPEPMGVVLGLLIATDVLSILRNLATAHNNIPVLDRYFKGLVKNLRENAAPNKEEGDPVARGWKPNS